MPFGMYIFLHCLKQWKWPKNNSLQQRLRFRSVYGKFSILLLSVTGYLSKGAAEQKARSTYEYLIDLAEDPDVLAPLRFLREREVVHFQRFGEALEIARDHLNQKHWFFK